MRRRLAAGSYASLRRLEAAEAAWAAAGYEARLHLRPGARHACVCVCPCVCVCVCVCVCICLCPPPATKPASTSASVRALCDACTRARAPPIRVYIGVCIARGALKRDGS